MVDGCLAQHGLPRSPRELGLSAEQFAEAVHYAARTRPGRYTLLEHLALGPEEVGLRVGAYVDAFDR